MSRKRKHEEEALLETCLIDNLPDPLLIEILLCLPLKTAKHCTLVCKRWYALLSDSYFASRFLHLNNHFAILFSYETQDAINRLQLATSPTDSFFRSPRAFSLSYLPCCIDREPAVAVAYCKDLLLCCPMLRSHYVYFICNPITRKSIQLPLLPFPPDRSTHFGLICEGQGSSFRYAVVRIPYSGAPRYSSKFKVQTFSSDTGKWAENMVSFTQSFPRLRFNNRRGVPYNGLLLSHQLIGLDPFNRGECRRLIDLPSGSSHRANLCLALCRGVLRLVEVKNDFIADVVSIRVWDLNNYEMGKWCLEHDITLSGLLSYTDSSHWFQLINDDDDDQTRIILPNALACHPDDADVVYILIDYKVASCNMRTQTLNDIYCNDTIIDFKYIGDAFPYLLPWFPTDIPSPLPLGCLPHGSHGKQTMRYRHKPCDTE